MSAELTCKLPTVAQEVAGVLGASVPGSESCADSATRSFKLDFLQYRLGELPQVDMPLKHIFTPMLYVREILMPKGAIVISRVHKCEHPFIVSKGRVAVWSENDGWQFITAPFTGVTMPGTRRILFIAEDCIWTTFHVGPWKQDMDPDEIVAAVTETPDVSFIGEMQAKARELRQNPNLEEMT